MRTQDRQNCVCTVCKSKRVRLVSETRTTATFVCGDCGWLRSVVTDASKKGRV